MTTTYCATTDVDFVLSSTGADRRADDNEDGSEDSGVVTNAIEVAATDMNIHLDRTYVLSDLSGNAWCKWTNAYLAAYVLETRLGNVASPSIKEERDKRKELLVAIGQGRLRVPEQSESFDGGEPMVSNFEVDLRGQRNRVRVVRETSVGPAPQSGVDRDYAEDGYQYY